jgi:Txe/YoeB family toxin of toxin-antitoxin system
MVKWTIKYSRRVLSDSLKLKQIGLKEKTKRLLDIIAEDPYASPPYFEKLSGFEDVYSRRINIRHRLVYQVLKGEMCIKILSLWGHYDDN